MLFSTLIWATPPPIINGTELTEGYEEVGALVASNGVEDVLFCSGTLIAPKYFLTAAHCISAMSSYDEQGLDIKVIFGHIQEEPVQVSGIERWVSHPDFEPSTLNHDLGIVVLETELSITTPLISDAIPDDSWFDRPAVYVGWGVTSDGAVDADTKRYANIPYYFFDAWTHYGVDLSGQTNLCTGDSGGPMYFSPSEANPVLLIGVNSFVFSILDPEVPCLGGGSGSVRLDRYIDWLAQEAPGIQIWEDADVDSGLSEDISEENSESETDQETEKNKEQRATCNNFSSEFGGLGFFWLLAVLYRRQ
ncbi:MAG: hypothetical protein CMK59_14715 [Proteobacteria bacterium]|nr:hypothetical protein [Pseudomonadota bacterium]